MDLKLAGKTALITGGSKGIGRAAAETMASEGCDVVLVARSISDLEAAKTAIAARAKVRIETAAVDLSVGANVAQLVRDYPNVDILVNNAGAIPGGSLLDVDEAKWRVAWDLKVFGYINMCRAYYPLMKARGGGVIVNVIGHTARSLEPGFICSATGNAALTGFTKALGSASVHDGIRVVGVSPGPVATDRLIGLMQKKAKENLGNSHNWPDLFKPLPFGRAAAPEEVGATIAFLASEHSGYISGSIVMVDAGLSIRAKSI